MTPTERKRAQRERDRAALWAPGASLDTLPGLLAGERPGTLSAVLAELGRRGGLTVTTRHAALGAGGRVRP